MKKLIILPIFLLLISTSFAQKNPKVESDQAVIRDIISQYALSINTADTDLAGKIFLQSDTISFLHPKGYEQGWDGIKNGVYGMFGTVFKARTLDIFDQGIEIYSGDMAVAVFYWKFDATFNDDTTIQTKGRETQIFHKIDGAWKIVHVHYSNMPVTGEKDGF